MSNEQTVKDVYAAFQRGDVNAIVALCTDDVDWRNDRVESRECPWNGDFSGKARLPEFFSAVGQHLDIQVFEPKTFASSGSAVAVTVRVESVLRKNNRPIKNDVVHFWTFDGAPKIASYRHYNDTAAELAAWRA